MECRWGRQLTWTWTDRQLCSRTCVSETELRSSAGAVRTLTGWEGPPSAPSLWQSHKSEQSSLGTQFWYTFVEHLIVVSTQVQGSSSVTRAFRYKLYFWWDDLLFTWHNSYWSVIEIKSQPFLLRDLRTKAVLQLQLSKLRIPAWVLMCSLCILFPVNQQSYFCLCLSLCLSFLLSLIYELPCMHTYTHLKHWPNCW